MIWVAAHTAAAIAGATGTHLLLDEDHRPSLWLTPRDGRLALVLNTHRLVHAAKVGEKVGVWHEATSDTLEDGVLLDHLDPAHCGEAGHSLLHTIRLDSWVAARRRGSAPYH